MVARLTSIVAIDRNGAIGCRNELPWKLKSDMAFFRTTTMGNTVIMGRKTYDSIGSPLPGRKNVVLSHNWQLFDSTADCQLANSIPECLAQAQLNRSREAYVIGGAATYREFASLVDRYLITVVDYEVPDADAFLSQEILDEVAGWDTQPLDSVCSSPDRDQYAFRVFEALAPDTEERADERQRMLAKVLIEKQKAAVKGRGPASDILHRQSAFAF